MPDYMFLLESRLSPEQRAAMLRVQELAAAMGFNVYLTGGTVRDLITGATLRDLDFSVEGNPSKMARELEKGGARVLAEDEKLRHIEILFAGDVDGSLSAARDEYYVRPGTRPEIRWSTIMEDLRRRDFSLNAIAISLNPASRGLLLDPTNGLSDIEHGEVRALTIHSFTNQPARLLRALRVAARMGFKLESRTQEWFNLAIERELQKTITPEDAGHELRALAREERPHLILKEWDEQDLLELVHPLLAKKHPDYEAISRLLKVRDELFMAGFRPRLANPMMLAILGRLKDREVAHVLSKLGFRAAEIEQIENFPEKALDMQKDLAGKKTKTPVDAFQYIEKMPLEFIAYLLAESNNSGAVSKLFFGMGVAQINFFVDTFFASASRMPRGSLAALYVSDRVMELVLGGYAIAVATAILPMMSHQAAANDYEGLKRTLTFAVRIVAYITIPAAIGLMILREPIIRMLFQHGQFVAESTRLTARPLLYYAAGLPALACVKLIVPAFYSAGDTKTPVIVALISFAINIILNIVFLHFLFRRFQNGGPALATVLATFFDFFTLFFIFRLRYGALGPLEIFHSIGKISLCSALMGVACMVANYYVKFTLQSAFFTQLLVFIALIGGATVLYIGLTWLFRCPEIEEVYGIATRRETAEELAGT